jgi:hypothetical protein
MEQAHQASALSLWVPVLVGLIAGLFVIIAEKMRQRITKDTTLKAEIKAQIENSAAVKSAQLETGERIAFRTLDEFNRCQSDLWDCRRECLSHQMKAERLMGILIMHGIPIPNFDEYRLQVDSDKHKVTDLLPPEQKKDDAKS